MIEKKLAEHIRQGNREAYRETRFPAIADYEELVFENENFTGTDFSDFPTSMNTFRACTLDEARLSPGQPIRIEECSAIGLSIEGIAAVINAKNSDFTDLRYDIHTVLAQPENGEAGCSKFENCTLDEATARFLAEQGVIIL